MNKIPKAKYDYAVNAKINKNAILKYLKAGEECNLETMANQLNQIFNEVKQNSMRLVVIEQKLGIQQTAQ